MRRVIRAYPPVPDEGGDDPRLHTLEYVVVDCETTGGSPGRGHRITEIAAIRVDRTGAVLDEFRSLVNPHRTIPGSVSRLTNITQGMVDEAPLFLDVATRVQQVLAGAVFVAHNAPFDLRFVQMEMKRGDLGAPKGRVLCTARLARKVMPQLRSRSLDSLIHYYGVYCEQRHRAYPDALATAEILVRLLDLAEEQGVDRWSELDTMLKRRKAKKKRTSLPTSMEFPEWA